MKFLKDFWVIIVAVVLFVALATNNIRKANAYKPTMTSYPAVVAPLSWDMIKKECKFKAKEGKKVPKHCTKYL